MDKVEYTKIKIYSFLGFNLFKTTEFYNEKSFEELEDDTPPINITSEYAQQEGFNDRKL